MNVTHQFRDVMYRTMTNLEIIEQLTNELPRESRKPFEVTQLVSSVMGPVAWPRERHLAKQLATISIATAVQEWGLPELVDEYPEQPATAGRSRFKPTDLDKLLNVLRNGFAHGNFRFNPGPDGQIESVHVWNTLPGRQGFAGQTSWGTTLSIEQMRQLLSAFVRLADHLYRQDEEQSAERALAHQRAHDKSAVVAPRSHREHLG